MIAVLKRGTTDAQIENLSTWLKSQGLNVHISKGSDHTVIGLVGDTSRIDPDLIESLEIVDAVKRYAADCAAGKADPAALDEAAFSPYLYTGDLPDPDLLIRTGGEMRISNFLLWQSAYAELYFTDTLWPEFKPAELDKAIAWFASRKRRFGRAEEVKTAK